ncbi:MAG: glucose-6-phosphate isomerase [Methyloligellaceae bacterium]
MAYEQAIEGCLEAGLGGHGLSRARLDDLLSRLAPELDALRAAHADNSLPLLKVPEWRDDLDEAAAALQRLCEGARTLVLFGTGGSSLGGQTVAQLGGWFIPGVETKGQKRRPRTRFYDNLDAATLERVLAGLDLERTRFVVTSKSGNTPETLVQAITALQAAKDAGLESRLPQLFLGISEPAREGTQNGLRTLFEAHGIPLLDHPPDIGGRFSALTIVGMIPALARGLDAAAFRSGARQVVGALLKGDTPEAFAPALGAAVTVGLMQEKGIRSLIMMPYSDRLGRFSHWFVQLWGESLGKQGQGSTPVAALGPVDQHSQLQLYLDGPRDHMITILCHECSGAGPRVDPGLAALAGAPYLADRAAGDLVAAQQRAIPLALREAGRPVRVIHLQRLDEAGLGALMMHFMLETILSARLLGVDPFGQPAVESGKELTRRYL